jgi:hypothetical protein
MTDFCSCASHAHLVVRQWWHSCSAWKGPVTDPRREAPLTTRAVILFDDSRSNEQLRCHRRNLPYQIVQQSRADESSQHDRDGCVWGDPGTRQSAALHSVESEVVALVSPTELPRARVPGAWLRLELGTTWRGGTLPTVCGPEPTSWSDPIFPVSKTAVVHFPLQTYLAKPAQRELRGIARPLVAVPSEQTTRAQSGSIPHIRCSGQSGPLRSEQLFPAPSSRIAWCSCRGPSKRRGLASRRRRDLRVAIPRGAGLRELSSEVIL